MTALLEIKDLSVSFGSSTILKKLNLSVEPHSITALIGMSGCGKTTLLRTLNRSIEQDSPRISGTVELSGQNIFTQHETMIKKEIGLIFQRPTPFPFSIQKNITYALNYHGITNKKQQQEIIKRCLQEVGLYEEVADKLNMDARNLSGGQQQRLCIARALAIQPQLLLLDEPCSSLDIKNMLKVEETVSALKAKCTVIIVTHNLAQAKRLADHTAYMENGTLVEYAPTEELFNAPQDPRTQAYIKYLD